MSFFADSLADYTIIDTSRIVTPALLLYPEKIQSNIEATIRLAGGDPNRLRPHIKTAKLLATVKGYVRAGIRQFKCSTTLELITACDAGADDVLVAFAMVGANASRIQQISAQYPNVKVSVLVETSDQGAFWAGSQIGVFIDVNSGMNRTGVSSSDTREIVAIAKSAGPRFRGLHWYDGHVSMVDTKERKQKAFAGYDGLMNIIYALSSAAIPIEEVITSGTPSAPYGVSYPGFQSSSFVHRVSPGTVIYNDLSSLKQLPDYGYSPAALVLATVISHPAPGFITCDAGHKAVSVDSGVPNCAALGPSGLTPLKPSEEHLPLQVSEGAQMPAIGQKLYLVPRHVCPTVNNFDQALFIRDGQIVSVEPVTARGHETPLALD